MKRLLIASAVAIAISATGSLLLIRPNTTSAGGETPLIIEVNRHSDELANHEARITNSENDITSIQNNTNTAPSTERTPVPVAVPESALSITIVAIEQIVVDELNTDCKLTFSNNTTSQVAWKVINPNGAWVTDAQGQNGHYAPSTQTLGKCDNTIIGTVRP